MIRNYSFFSLFIVLMLLLTNVGVGLTQNETVFKSNPSKGYVSDHNSSIPSQNNGCPFCYTMERELICYEQRGKKPTIQDTPSSFSWKSNNGDWTTKAKNQGGCGSCWAFAALGILESKINIKENNPDLNPDLSEQYVLSCLSNAGSCQGGSSTTALQLIMDTTPVGNGCNGVPLESCMPYTADDALPCEEKSEDWNENLVPITGYDVWISDGSEIDRQHIKSQIMESGPLVTGILADDEFTTWGLLHHNISDYFAYQSHTIWSNHVIMIVGWYDDPSIDQGGYWICKNSWGSFWGYDGFFNIEYGAKGIDHGYIISVDYDAQRYDWPPIAKIQGPFYSKPNESLVFSAEQSFDVEGDLTEYHWDFGDGKTADGLLTEHIYATEGMYRLILMVTDETGKTDAIERAVMIQPWQGGNQWKYQFNEVMIQVDTDDFDSVLQAEIPSITFELSNESAEYYEMTFEASFQGDFTVSSSDYSIIVNFKKTYLSGSILFSKQNLSMQQVQLFFSGRFHIKEVFPFALSVPFSIHAETSFSPGFNYIQFPLYESKMYDVPCSNFIVRGTVSSPMFNFLSFVNTVAGFFGRDFIPKDIAEILPDIKIDEVLSLYDLDNVLRTPYVNDLHVIEETINTPAGVFSSYTIKKQGFGEISFSPVVQNLVKINISVDYIDFLDTKLKVMIQGSLVSSNVN